MRVCIDVQSAVAQRAGVGRYTKSLVEHLPCENDLELRLFYFDFCRQGLSFCPEHMRPRAVRWLPGRAAQFAWKTIGFPPFQLFAGPADVYHFPNFILPPLRGRAVVTIHDLAFMRFPDSIEDKNYHYLTRHIRDTVNRAAAIVTVSRFAADEIVDLLGVDPDRVFAVHHGIDPTFAPPPAAIVATARANLGLGAPYLLHVGTLEPRKSLEFLVDVFDRLDGYDGNLVLAGRPGWKAGPLLQRIARSPRAERILVQQDVPDRQLCSLYAGADLFLFPSLYEGFGFPPLEAMACGTPVIASRAGSLPEVLGDAAVLLDTSEPDAWTSEIQAVLGDTERQKRLISSGKGQAAGYTWERAAAETVKIYREVGA